MCERGIAVNIVRAERGTTRFARQTHGAARFFMHFVMTKTLRM